MALTDLFTNRADDYARYRPSYPDEVLALLRQECGLIDGLPVADVGAGTGIFSRRLLEAGAEVYAVEPNDAMRQKAELSLGDHPRFHSVAATAEATGLPDAAVGLVTAAQALHWFRWPDARAEFRRILSPEGVVAIVWNSHAGGPFTEDRDRMVNERCTDYRERFAIRHQNEEIAAFFENGHQEAGFPHVHNVDFECFVGGSLSGSWAPKPGHPEHEAFLEGLEDLFARHSRDGILAVPYIAEVYWGRP